MIHAENTSSACDLTRSNRLHGFDALRAVAILLVLLLHAAAPYLSRPMPGLLWPTHDAAPSQGVTALFWWIECFIMALCFAMSGFFAAQLMQRRGPHKFLAHRCKRLLVPLLVASAIILPLTGYVWVLGWVLDGKVPPVKLRSFTFDAATESQLWGFAHLWFLQYLFCYSLAFWTIRTLVTSRSGTGGGNEAKRWSPSAGAGLGVSTFCVAPVACAIVLWFDPHVVLGFQQSIAPVSSRLIYYGIFFAFGVLLFYRRGWIETMQRRNAAMLLLSLLAFAIVLPLINAHLVTESDGASRWVLAGLVTLFAWLTTCGLFGLFSKASSRPGRTTRYVADASYWLYLTHLPFVGAAHVLMAQSHAATWIKLVVSFSLALGVTLLGYQFLVRKTLLRNWLDGSRRPGTGNTSAATALSTSRDSGSRAMAR